MKKCLFFVFFVACTPTTLNAALNTTVAATNEAYGFAVDACDAKEKAIIERTGSTEAADEADIAKVRGVCDKMFAAFDNARSLVGLTKELEGI